jgi:uncharacterized membrane protein YeiH
MLKQSPVELEDCMSTYTVITYVFELGGIFAFATLGASLCLRRNLNLVAVTLYALISALGGGLLRDLVIGAPPVAFQRLDYLGVALAGAGVGVALRRQMSRFLLVLQIIEALALGLLCVSGAAKAYAAGQPAVAAVALGVITGIGGGVLRDILTGVTPVMFLRGREVQLAPIVLGSVTTTALLHLDRLDHTASLIVAAATGGVLLAVLLLGQLRRRAPSTAPRAALADAAQR